MACQHLLVVAAFLFDAASLVDALAKTAAKDGKFRNVDPERQVHQPQQLFDTMSSRMAELQQGLMTAQSESQSAVAKTRDLYDQKLKDQQSRNNATTMLNQDIAARIKSLKVENEQLRAHAGDLSVQCHEVRQDLDELRANVTLAQEYMDRALNDSLVSLTESAELSILAELEHEATNSTERRQHEGHLEEISKAATAAMMQLGAVEQKFHGKSEHPTDEDDEVQADASGAMPQELLQKLLSTWSEGALEQNASQASLKESFEKENRVGEEQYGALLQEQMQLNTTVAEQEDQKQKLTTAVQYLEQTHEQLVEQRTSVRHFARRLSHRPLPAAEDSTKVHLLAASKGNSKRVTVAAMKPALKKAAPTKARKQ